MSLLCDSVCLDRRHLFGDLLREALKKACDDVAAAGSTGGPKRELLVHVCPQTVRQGTGATRRQVIERQKGSRRRHRKRVILRDSRRREQVTQALAHTDHTLQLVSRPTNQTRGISAIPFCSAFLPPLPISPTLMLQTWIMMPIGVGSFGRLFCSDHS